MENNKQNIFLDDLQKFYQEYRKLNNHYVTIREENQHLRAKISILNDELSESRRLERSHQEQLEASRNIISDLQNAVSHLVYLKEEVKNARKKLEDKDAVIKRLVEERDQREESHNRDIERLRQEYEYKFMDEQAGKDLKIAHTAFQVEELKATIKSMEDQHKEKLNLVVLEYEERLQRNAAQVTQLREEQAALSVNTHANVEVYQRKISSLEDKIKSMEFDLYLAKNVTFNDTLAQSTAKSQNFMATKAFGAGADEAMHEESAGIPKPVNKVNARKIASLQPMARREDPQNDMNSKEKKVATVKKRKLFSNKMNID